RAFASLTLAGASWERIPRVMTSQPELIGDETWIDVRLMQATEGRLVAKTGAEGLLCIGVRDKGLGMAIKVEDGAVRPLGLFAVTALARLGWLLPRELESPLLQAFMRPIIFDSTGRSAAEIRIEHG